MIISDLNHIEVVEANVSGGYYNPYTHFQNVYVQFNAYSSPYVSDNSALAEAGASAYGSNTFTKSVTNTSTSSYSSQSGSVSISVTDDPYYYW